MSSKAILLATGIAVRVKGKNSFGNYYELLPTGKKIDGTSNFLEESSGGVIEFLVNEVKFIYVDNSYLIPNDNKESFWGFCKEEIFINYKNRRLGYDEFRKLSDHWFTDFEFAQNGDEIIINRMEFYDSSKFYIEKSYQFTISNIEKIDFYDYKTYPSPIIKDISPTYLLSSFSGKFYQKNIPVIERADSIAEKEYYIKCITLIAINIRNIHLNN